ncbi:MAG TPA: hypothetical protein VNJ53_02730 [Gaiellaceae bacterium]|nr:hypothetical protein [Gaiellaceae bacterium]
MREQDLPVFELSVVFAASRERAGEVLDLVVELVCRETGGSGAGSDHVCGGFHCAGVRELPGGLLEALE